MQIINHYPIGLFFMCALLPTLRLPSIGRLARAVGVALGSFVRDHVHRDAIGRVAPRDV